MLLAGRVASRLTANRRAGRGRCYRPGVLASSRRRATSGCGSVATAPAEGPGSRGTGGPSLDGMQEPGQTPAVRPAAAEPLSSADLTLLATDCGPAPMNIAAVLLVDGADDGTDEVPALLAERAAAVPRFRQVVVPARRGRAAWQTDPRADPAAHVTRLRLAGGGRRAVLDEAGRLAATPLDRSRPLWAAWWLTGWDEGARQRGALVLVLHHVLVDGVGALEMLASLADPRPDAPDASPPRTQAAAVRPRPSLRAVLHGLLELRPGVLHLAARTSINRPTEATRRIGVVCLPLADLRDGAHRHGGTVNDAIVAAVVGALTRLLAARGEHPRSLVVSVPITARAPGDRRVGNRNGVLPVAVPTAADLRSRVRHVAEATARRKSRPRGRSAAPLGLAFRGLARLGLFRPFIEHQRLVHTFETNVRGPAERHRLGGHEVSAVLPVAVSPGNVGASFAALSYAGGLCVTVITDPSLVPEADALVAHLADGLSALSGRLGFIQRATPPPGP